MKRQVVLSLSTIEYDLIRKPIRRMYLRIKSSGDIVVTANPKVSVDTIEDFVRKNEAFIYKNLEKFRMRKKPPISYVSGDTIPVFGKDLPLVVIEGSKNQAEFTEEGILLTVKNADDFALKERVLTKFLNTVIEKTVTDYAVELYPFFTGYCPSFPVIKFRKMRSRWGSCIPKKNQLNFNYRLIVAEPSAVEYVVIHEFCHFIEANHSPAFYREVARFMPDYKEKRKKLKKIVLE